VENGLYENAEAAIEYLMSNPIIHQIVRYRGIIEKFENKYAIRFLLGRAVETGNVGYCNTGNK